MQYDPGNNFFGDYADIYAEAPYNDFTEGVAKDLPELLSFYGADTGSYLDLGYGTRTLLIAPAGRFERVHEFAELNRAPLDETTSRVRYVTR